MSYVSKELRKEPSAFSQFILGFLFGALVFVVVALIATLILERLPNNTCAGGFSLRASGCIPVIEYGLLRAASWGPAAIFSLASATGSITPLQWQGISGLFLGIIGGIIFVVPPRRSVAEIYLGVYALLLVLVAFFIVVILVAR